jgi:hypothetical protein
MTMTDAALWLIFIAIIVIVPIGCVVTRPKKIVPGKETVEPADE